MLVVPYLINYVFQWVFISFFYWQGTYAYWVGGIL